MRSPLYQPFPMLHGRRAQIWRYLPAYRRPRHFHDEPELNLVMAGTGTFGTGRDTIRVAAGDMLCWPPGRDHELLEASPDFDLFVVAMTPELCSRALCERSALALAGPVRTRLPAPALGRLQALCAPPSLTSEASVAESHVAELWLHANDLRLKTQRRASLTERVLKSLLEQPELGRGERARLLGAPPSELSRHFHRDFGLTLNAYRTRLRLLHFIQLADGRDHTLLRAALEAGFGSYSQCHRAFHVAFGCTPSKFFETSLRREMQQAFAPWSERAVPGEDEDHR